MLPTSAATAHLSPDDFCRSRVEAFAEAAKLHLRRHLRATEAELADEVGRAYAALLPAGWRAEVGQAVEQLVAAGRAVRVGRRLYALPPSYPGPDGEPFARLADVTALFARLAGELERGDATGAATTAAV